MTNDPKKHLRGIILPLTFAQSLISKDSLSTILSLPKRSFTPVLSRLSTFRCFRAVRATIILKSFFQKPGTGERVGFSF